MKPCLKLVLILFSVVFAVGSFPMDEAAAQGPIIRRMREKLNRGKPLLPFISESAAPKAKAPAKQPTLATRNPTPTRKAPTPARKAPTQATTPTLAKPNVVGKGQKKYPSIKLQSNPQAAANATVGNAGVSREFGMKIQSSGEAFVVSQVDPRGNAAAAGIQRGDVVTAIGGAKLLAVEEFDAIVEAMGGGDRVEFEISRRGQKAQKMVVQFGQHEEPEADEEVSKFEVAPSITSTPEGHSDRYVPSVGSGLKSVYDGSQKPSSVLTPTPAPNRVESLEALDFPALDGGR